MSDGRITENLLQRNFTAEGPNQKWVTDVTPFQVFDDRIYLSAIKDLWNNEIVAYHLSQRNDNPLVLETFRKAFEKQKDVAGLIVHSDQGYQYTSHAYHDMLPKVGAQISMSRRGNCYDNASMESFFSHLKVEALYPYDIPSIEEAQRRIEEFILFYNEKRAQRKLNGVLTNPGLHLPLSSRQTLKNYAASVFRYSIGAHWFSRFWNRSWL